MSDIEPPTIPKPNKMYYSVIMWCPFGIPETNGASALPIGLMFGLADDTQTAIGLIDPVSLNAVADALGMDWKGRMNDVDWAFIESIIEKKNSPHQARAAFSGTRPYCYQHWYVTQPHAFFTPRSAVEQIPVMWTRLSTLPLTRIEVYPTRNQK